jgi:nitrate reductase NapE component
MAKFSYNVIVGLAATVVVAADAQTSSDVGFLLLLSILAPILALALAGGGGMAVFRGVSGGVTRIVSVGTSFLPMK